MNQELSEWDIYHLGQYARYAAEGWFYVELAPDSEGNRCLGLVHEDVPCAHSGCTLARVRGHRYTATPEQREEMQDLYVTPWLTHLFKQEEAAAEKQADIDELERMWSLSPEPFFCNFKYPRGACRSELAKMRWLSQELKLQIWSTKPRRTQNDLSTSEGGVREIWTGRSRL